MKVTVNEEEVMENSFPKLMIYTVSDLIVLMTSSMNGIVVAGNSYHELGKISDTWDMQHFKDFNGTVTLQNN